MDSNEAFNTRYFKFHKNLLKILAIWPYSEKTLLKTIVRIFILAIILSCALPMIIKEFEEWREVDKNWQIIVENICFSVIITGTSMRFLQHLFMEKMIKRIYTRINDDWKNKLQNEEEESILFKSWNIGRIMTLMYLMYVLGSWFSFAAMPVFAPTILDVLIPLNESRPKTIVVFTEYFVDQEKYFWPIYAHMFISMTVITAIVLTADSIYVSCICHCFGLYNILKYRMKKIYKMTESQLKCDSNQEKQIYSYILQTIRLHVDTIEYFELIQWAWAVYNFITISLLLLDLTIGGMLLIESYRDIMAFIRAFLIWFGHIVYLYFLSWPSQQLLNKNEELFDAIYFCGWYKLSIKSRYLIHFMLVRCSIPAQLTAGPMMEMNMRNFGSVLRTALSYFTFARSVKE